MRAIPCNFAVSYGPMVDHPTKDEQLRLLLAKQSKQLHFEAQSLHEARLDRARRQGQSIATFEDVRQKAATARADLMAAGRLAIE